MRSWAGVIAAVALGASATAQTSLPLDQRTEAPAETKVGGTLAVDLIMINGAGVGTPLRFGNVLPGSESITLDGRELVAARDYGIDYAVGIVYLKTPAKLNQALSVRYRYDKTPITAAALTQLGILGGHSLSIAPGANLLLGLGYADRTTDGRVMSGNAFGWNNAFKFGGGSLSGALIAGQRSQSQNQAGLNMDLAPQPGTGGEEQGDSQLVIQGLDTKALGGRVKVDYQNVSTNFAAFNALAASGFDQSKIDRIRAERGLTRMGYAFDGVKAGGMAFSNSYRKVSDENGTIDWRTYGVQSGGLKLNYDSRTVGRGFGRFLDIGESERDVLARETGLVRQNWAGEFANKTDKLTFNSFTLQDDATGQEIRKQEYGFNASKFGFAYGTQQVGPSFARIDSLMDDEKARYGREAGLRRQWMKLTSSLTGADTPWSFDQSRLDGPTGSYVAADVALKGKTWGLTHAVRKADEGFGAFGGMQDAEQDANITSIAKMYGPTAVGSAADRPGLAQSAGIERSYSTFSAQPFKGWKLDLAKLDLRGKVDGGRIFNGTLDTGSAQFTYREQRLGEQFTELTRLMGFEQATLSPIVGVDRTDFGLKMNLGGLKRFSFDQMSTDATEGGARRMVTQYTDKKIEVIVKSREVDSGFQSVNLLADPEKDLLTALKGFSQREMSLKWQLAANLNVVFLSTDAQNSDTDTASKLRNLFVDWKPDAKTGLQYSRNETMTNDPLGRLFANITERFAFNRDFGKLGLLQLTDERQSLDGRTNTTPDIRKQYLSYQAKLSPTTEARTEQTRTEFGNGTSEKISANTVSTALSKRAGVSVTESQVKRTDETTDEKRRDYGFWVDFGKGLRFSYGYARQLVGETAGQATSTVAVGKDANRITPDQTATVQPVDVQGVNVGGGYGVNYWDQDKRTQGFTNFAISSAKPLSMGFLKDVTFQFGMDSASDQANYVRDNQIGKFGAKIGSNTIGYEFTSQWSPLGARGIDRVYRFSTDSSDKRFLTGSIFYKARTLPTDEQIMVRDFNVAVRPAKDFAITHQLQTNPEIARPDLILGSLPQASRSNKWGLDWKRSVDLTVGMSWQELINDLDGAKSRTGGVTFSLFEAKGSPLKLFYGLEQTEGNVPRQTRHRYSMQYDQKAGANQSFSFFVGNLNYQHSIAEGLSRNNWTMRFNYQLKF